MAQLIPKFLSSAFERMGNSDKSLEQVALNTGQTAASVSVGGDLYEKMDELCKALKGDYGKGKGGKVSIKEALVLRITAGALEPIGLGLGIIIDALERAPEGKELKLKMEALTGGLLALGDIGYSILKFAAMMILALPLLIVAGVAMLVIVPLLKLMVDGLMFATKKLDKKQLKKIAMLGEIGVNILILAVSLVLVGLLATYALKGVLVAAGILLGLAGIMFLLEKMKFDPKGMKEFSKGLKNLALGLLGLTVSLVLIGFLSEYVLAGLGTALLVIASIAGIFWVMDKMGVTDVIEDTGKALIYAAGAILSTSIAIVLSHMILGAIGFTEVAKVLLVVAGVAAAFALIGTFSDKIEGGGKAMLYVAGAILAVSIAIWFMNMILGDFDTADVMNSFRVLAVIGGIGIVFALAGLAEKQIKSGSIAMMFAGGAMIVIAIGVWAMTKALEGVKWEDLGMIAAVVVGVGLAFGIAGAGPIPLAIALGSAAMILAGAALIVIAIGTASMAAAVKGVTMEEVLTMGAIIAGIAVAMAAAGLASPLIILGSAAMIVAGAASILLGGALAVLSTINFSKLGTLSQKGSKAFDWSGERGFFGGKKTNFETAMDAIADGMSLNPLSIIGIATGAPMILLAGTALIAISLGLQKFAEIAKDADLPSLKTNMQLIVSGLADTFAEVGTKYPGGGKSLLSALTGNTSGQSVVAQGISAVSGMGGALTGIAMGVQAMAMLKFPTGFDKDGKPTGYQTIDLTTAVPALIANTKLIVAGLSSVFSEVGSSSAAQGSSWFSSSAYEKGINVVKQMGEPLYNLANGVQNMANLKFPTGFDKDGKATGYESISSVDKIVKKLAKNTKALIIGLSGVFEEVGASGVGDGGGWFSSSNFEKGAQIVLDLAAPYTSLAGTVDNVVKITSKITDAVDVREKVTAIIDAITGTGEDTSVIKAKATLVATIGGTYKKLGVAIPLIIDSIAQFTVDKAKAFASIFGGESDPESFGAKSKFLNTLKHAYLQMAIAIPLIVGSVGTVDAAQLDAFTAIYGGSMESGDVGAKTTLFVAVGKSYERIGNTAPKLAQSINSLDLDKAEEFSKLFVGRVSMLRPVAGYEAQTELWEQIGSSVSMSGNSMPKVASAINAIDLTKLVESRKMFEALGVLSHGGSPGDVLAQMGESLEDALNNLASMLNEFKDTVQAGNEEQGGIISKIGDTISKVTGIGGSSNSSSPRSKPMPSKMTVKLDAASIKALKGSGMSKYGGSQ